MQGFLIIYEIRTSHSTSINYLNINENEKKKFLTSKGICLVPKSTKKKKQIVKENSFVMFGFIIYLKKKINVIKIS